MALADMVQGAFTVMCCQFYHQPKYVDTIRKVAAGLGSGAGKRYFTIHFLYSCVLWLWWLMFYFLMLGFSMSLSLMLMKLQQVGEAQSLLFPPPLPLMHLMLNLWGGVQSPLCQSLLDKNGVEEGFLLMSQTLSTALGTEFWVLLKNNCQVLTFFLRKWQF